MTAFPTFEEFYLALRGHPPFPWQSRLARQVVSKGWPQLLDLPTGVGKTSVLDIALYALASAPTLMPRRTVLVIDRRIVVDQGAALARSALKALRESPNGALRGVADALRSLWGATTSDDPFAVAVMRGGMPRDNDWAKRPDQPVLGVSTVDQVGSRLLFRGYGIGHNSASIHAGLIGNDTLLFLDEVHLSEPFAQTLSAISRLRSETQSGLKPRFGVVRMSATPGRTEQDTFTLGDDDRNHPVLVPRLRAQKRAQLVAVKATGDDEAKKRAAVALEATSAALGLRAKGANAVAIVVNRVDTARLVYRQLAARSEDTILVTGRMRAIERDNVVRERLLPLAGVGRSRAASKPVFVVATQCIEAGADLDFDGLVTECASLDALKQRFGRVDRIGELGQTASVILCRTDQSTAEADDPIYGNALGATWTWLSSLDAVDFGVQAMLAQQHASSPELLAPRPRAPVLLPAHVDSWAQTSQRPAADPDVSLWLHGPERDSADVQVIWRDIQSLAPAGFGEDEADTVSSWLSACRPSSLEAITVPIGSARRWLAGLPPLDLPDTVATVPDEDAWRTQSQSTNTAVGWRWSGGDAEPVKAQDIRPGDVIIVDINRGGISAGSFDPDAKDLVTDLGDLAQLRARGKATLRLLPSAMVAWGLPPESFSSLDLEVDGERKTTMALRVELEELLERALPESIAGGTTKQVATAWEYNVLRSALKAQFSRKSGGVEGVGDHVVLEATLPKPKSADGPVEAAEVEDAYTEGDQGSFLRREVTLAEHSADVQGFAAAFCRNLHLPEELARDVTFAAWMHDVGKADRRFQQWLVGGSDVGLAALGDTLLAKSAQQMSRSERMKARRRARYPQGYRHELLSLSMLESTPSALAGVHDRDLVLHLVASHHGWCRPFAPPVDDPEPHDVGFTHGDEVLVANSRHHKARLDSGVAERFWGLVDRYGWWGLAWLEAILRLADHRASELKAGGLE